MASELWERVKPIFHAASELEASERSTYLDGACRDDAELRREVERLLALHEASGAFLDHPTSQTVPDEQRRASRRTLREDETLSERFRIVRFVGSGGMGEVYEAQDLELKERVALKTLRPELVSDEVSLTRFKREIQLARRVSHKNVCRIFDGGRHRADNREIAFLTMEYLEGETLSAYLKRRGRLSSDEALPLLRQMAEALNALHEANIIHRDFKSANVILEPVEGATQRAVVTDFGLARPTVAASSTDSMATNPGQMLGTPDYMAPEQLAGEELGPYSDVYAFGVVAYEILCGRRPFPSDAMAKVIVHKLTQAPTPPRDLVPEMDPRWEEFLLGCLEREPKERIVSPQEVLRRLDGLASANSFVVREPIEPTAPRWTRRLRWALSATAATALVAGIWQSPTLRTSTLTRLCDRFPGSSWFCRLPDDKDLSIPPFDISAASEDGQALAAGLSQVLLQRLVDLNPNKGDYCVHPRQDGADYGMALRLEGEVHVDPEQIRVRARLREVETAEQEGAGRILRRLDRDFARDDIATLHESILAELAQMMEWGLTEEQLAATDEAPNDSEAFPDYLTGTGLLHLGEAQQASTRFDESLRRDFSFAAAHTGLGSAYQALWRQTSDSRWLSKSRNSYERAIGLSDRQVEARRGLGELELSVGRADDAVAELRSATKGSPYSFEALTSLASAYEAAGRDDLAEDVYRKGIDQQKECWRIRNYYADFCMRHGRYGECEQELLNVIRLAPAHAVIYHNLAYIYIKIGRYEDAVEMAAKAVQLRASSLWYSTLGRAYMYRGCVDDALVNLEHASNLEPEAFEPQAGLATVFERIPGREEDSKSSFRRVVELARAALRGEPGLLAERKWLSVALARLGRFEEASQEIKELLRLDPNSADSLFYAAIVREQAGERADALKLLQASLDQGLSVFEVQQTPWLDDLRSDQEYHEILTQLGWDASRNDPGVTTTLGVGTECPSWRIPGRGFSRD